MAGTTLDDLANKVVKTSAPVTATKSTSTTTDRGIKGTLIDDYAIEVAMKIATLATILILGSIGYLALERAIGVKVLTMIRVWLPVIGWGLLAFFTKPFLRFGWWGVLATLTVIPTTSGYLWQLFQGMVGAR